MLVYLQGSLVNVYEVSSFKNLSGLEVLDARVQCVISDVMLLYIRFIVISSALSRLAFCLFCAALARAAAQRRRLELALALALALPKYSWVVKHNRQAAWQRRQCRQAQRSPTTAKFIHKTVDTWPVAFRMNGHGLRLVAYGLWLLAVGCWLLVIGCTPHAAHCLLLAFGCWPLAQCRLMLFSAWSNINL